MRHDVEADKDSSNSAIVVQLYYGEAVVSQTDQIVYLMIELIEE